MAYIIFFQITQNRKYASVSYRLRVRKISQIFLTIMHTYVTWCKNIFFYCKFQSKSLKTVGVNQSSCCCFPCDWLIYVCATEFWTMSFERKFSKCHAEKFLSDSRNLKIKESYFFLSVFSCMCGCANLGLLQNLANMRQAGLWKNQPLRHNKAESSNGPGFLMMSVSCQVTLVFSYLWTFWCDIIVCY